MERGKTVLLGKKAQTAMHRIEKLNQACVKYKPLEKTIKDIKTQAKSFEQDIRKKGYQIEKEERLTINLRYAVIYCTEIYKQKENYKYEITVKTKDFRKTFSTEFKLCTTQKATKKENEEVKKTNSLLIRDNYKELLQEIINTLEKENHLLTEKIKTLEKPKNRKPTTKTKTI